jgi:short-subunit dehydrogenase
MFAGKVWWVTGASSGIGQALAAELAARGASLILSGRNEAALAEVLARTGGNGLVLPFEATDFDRIGDIVERAWSFAAERAGGIYGLINNAGITQRSLAVNTSFEVYRRIVDVDLLGPIALTQALLPRLVQKGEGQVVAISSVAGICGAPMRSAYSAAKHGLIGYHDALRAETAHLGLKVLVVAPGSVRTNVAKNALTGSGATRGVSDSIIDNGMDPGVAATRILAAVADGTRELILAEGAEAESARLRRADPDRLFDRMANLVAGGYSKLFENT